MENPVLLVVDDNRPIRDSLARRLTKEGFEVMTAENGQSALNTIAGHPISVVLLDLEMPDMTGLEVLARVRRHQSLYDLPVMMISASDDATKMVEAIDSGANDFLLKPVQFHLLLAKIRQLLRMRREGGEGAPASSHTSWEEREQLAHYHLLEPLGSGSMGTVYRAMDTRLLRQVALKVIRSEVSQSRALERFFLEARTVARVDHPGVVRIYELGLEPVRYIAMEYVSGRSLMDYAERGLSIAQICSLVRQLLEALHAVHAQGIIHRDLKPGNVLVTADGRVKLMDFGLAMTAECDPLRSHPDEQVGTPAYMAPEAVTKGGVVDDQSDLYSVAVILYELLTGELPFQGETLQDLLLSIARDDPPNPRVLREDVPVWLCAVCLKGMSKEKADRFPDARTFAGALSE